MVLVGLGSIFAAESFRPKNAQPGKRYSRVRRLLKTVQLPLVKPMMLLMAIMMMPAGSCPIEVGMESAVTLTRLAAKRRISTAMSAVVSGLIARQTEDCPARFHQM